VEQVAGVEEPPVAGSFRAASRGGGRLKRSQRRAGLVFSLPVILLTAGLLFLPIAQTM
jgi:hypothetical protein